MKLENVNMRLNNPLQMNDWEIGRFFKVVLAIQLAMWGVIGLDAIGIQIPILRQLIGFIYLTFIPGIIILRILKVHKLGNIETLLYTVGLSIATLMFTGLFMNTVYPFFGISGPISTWPVAITITIFILALCIISYLQDKEYQPPTGYAAANLKEFLSPPYLFLTLLPLLAALGGVVVTFYHNNIILLIVIILIALVPVLVAFTKFIPEKAYPFAILAISLALLLHVTMVSMYPMRLNVDGEFYYQNLVIQNAFWDSSLSATANTVLSITILGPMYSTMLRMNSIWLFKLIYPIIFSMVPLVLYQICSKQLGNRYSFLSAFFFVSGFYFYVEAPLLRRQQIAILGFALIILLLVERKLLPVQKVTLTIIFAFLLVVSHYSTSYICLILFTFAYLLFFVLKSKTGNNLLKRLQNKISFLTTYKKFWTTAPMFYLLTSSFICLYFVFDLAWFMYTGSGSSFDNAVMLGNHIYLDIDEFLDPTTKSPLIESAFGIGLFSAPFLNKIYRLLYYTTQLCIIIGFLRSILRPERFSEGYIVLSTACASFLFISIVVPFLSVAMNMPRIYFILLILLSPFCIIGGKTTWEMLTSLSKRFIFWLRMGSGKCYEGLSELAITTDRPPVSTFSKVFVLIILVPYFLFNVGFVFAVGGYTQEDILTCGVPASASLSYGKIDTGYHNQQEFVSAKRLAGMISQDSMIYADACRGTDLISAWHGSKTRWFPQDLKKIESTSYVFLRTWNIDKNEIFGITYEEGRRKLEYVSLGDMPGEYDSFGKRGKIYDNGGAVVLGEAIE